MDLDQDTFLTTVYTVVDEIYSSEYAPTKPPRCGKKPVLADSEVLTLVLLAQWRQDRSERAFLRFARRDLLGYFPNLLSQSAFNRRARDLVGVLGHLGPAIAAQTRALTGFTTPYQVIDGVPVPLARRCRGQHHRLFANEAAIGRGGSDHDWFFGVRVVLAVDDLGQITGAVSGPANTEEHWLGEALFRWRADETAPPPRSAELAEVLGPAHRNHGQRQGPTGPIGLRYAVGATADCSYLADLGYRGTNWAEHWRTSYGAAVLTKADYPNKSDRKWFSRRRQIVETVNGLLADCFGLNFPRARCPWGLYTRLAAKIAALNLMVHINHLFGRPNLARIDFA